MARNNILDPQRHRLGEEVRNTWVVNAEEGTTIQDVMEPAYWSHVASRLRPYDHIEVRLETGEWIAEMLVLSQGLNWARVHMLHHHDLVMSHETPPESQKHEVKWRGPHNKWCVIRLTDKQVLQAEMEKDQAIAWLTNYERTTV
jgi:hypothetical protein